MIIFSLKADSQEKFQAFIDMTKDVESVHFLVGKQKYLIIAIPGRLKQVLHVIHNSGIAENVECDAAYKVK